MTRDQTPVQTLPRSPVSRGARRQCLDGRPSTRRRRRESERGSGSLLVLGVVSVLLTLTLALAAIGSVVVCSHRARSAADLAAITGARAAVVGSGGCAAAGRVAQANGARITGCASDPGGLTVTVEVPSPFSRLTGALPPVSARARAGPAPEGGGPERGEAAG